MSESVYFFDEHQKLIRIVREEELLEVIQEKELTKTKEELLKDTLNVTILFDEQLQNAAYMAVKEEQTFSLYRIVVDSESEDQQSFMGISFAPDELDSYIVKDYRPDKQLLKTVATNLLKETDWRVGYVSSTLGIQITDTFYYVSVKEALKHLQTYGCEILFKYEVANNQISDKWIEIHSQIGEPSNQRFVYGEQVLTIEKEQDRNQVYTSLIGRGKGEDVGDGYGKRLDFSAIEWKKTVGAPLDKPKGQHWLEFPEMTQIYGIPLTNGKMRKKEKVIVFEDVEDAEELLKLTYEALVDNSRPLIQFKTTVLQGDVIGNTVTIHHYERNYHYRTRIFKTKTDRLSGKVEASLGDNLTKNVSKNIADLKGSVDSLEGKKMNFYESEEISKWQDDIIRGAKGGSIMLMNAQDLNKGDSRQPYQQVFMDGDSLETSKNFLIMNSEGIGFTTGNVNNKMKTAWTIDGSFNAQFIKTGTLEGILIKGCEFQTIDDTFRITIKDGQINFRDIKNNKNLGSLTATFGDNVVNGFAITQQPNSIFSLNSSSKTDERISKYVIQIPKESHMDAPKVNSRGVWTHNGDLHINGRLFINGKEVKPETGGSSGGGNQEGIPPQLTTEAEKNAWICWQFLKAQGYSEQAAAGILGNIEAESAMMPDVTESGGAGPGYGLVQWTSPIAGESGVAYVQRLMQQAGITGSYKDTLNQIKLVDWHMYNGQWIGVISPTTVSGFKQTTDIYTATVAFLKNFERAGVEALQKRVDAANYWYNKLRNLAASSEWMNPVRSSYVVTQEWDQIGWGTGQIHGGIDLASVPAGSTPPIYAAKAGTVITSTFDATGGNYIVIDHGGYYSYYGHLSSIHVKVGDTVTTNTQIGVMGTTGLSTGVHLHFEVWKDTQWNRINPRSVINF